MLVLIPEPLVVADSGHIDAVFSPFQLVLQVEEF